MRAAFFVHTSCVSIYADKSLEECNCKLPTPGAHHYRQFINRETHMHAPIQTLGFLSLKPGCCRNLGSHNFFEYRGYQNKMELSVKHY